VLKKLKLLFECFFNWPFCCSIKPEGKVEDADVIIAPSFGQGKNDPGFSNVDIAGYIFIALMELQNLPLILQWEVESVYSSFLKGLEERPTLHTIKTHHQWWKYLDTYEMLSQAKQIMEQEGWSKPVLVAHSWHLWRAKRVLEKMGINPIIPSGLNIISFDSESTQWWTRNWLFWILREIPARLIHFKRGWI